jgi:hypothetical protein
MFDLFGLALATLIVTIVVVIVRAVRLTNASIATASRDIPLSQPDVAARLINQMRGRDVRCPRCGQPACAALGTGNRYLCENGTCRQEFEGPEHFSPV